MKLLNDKPKELAIAFSGFLIIFVRFMIFEMDPFPYVTDI